MTDKEEVKVTDKQFCDPKGTAFNREAGHLHELCGTPMKPLFMGNALYGHRCPKCNVEVEA